MPGTLEVRTGLWLFTRSIKIFVQNIYSSSNITRDIQKLCFAKGQPFLVKILDTAHLTPQLS